MLSVLDFLLTNEGAILTAASGYLVFFGLLVLVSRVRSRRAPLSYDRSRVLIRDEVTVSEARPLSTNPMVLRLRDHAPRTDA